MSGNVGTVAVLWRGEPGELAGRSRTAQRLLPIVEALVAAGVVVEPVLYSEARHVEVWDLLLGVDGVLVWVDPISGGVTRAELDALLRDVGKRGVWVSADPDVIDKIGTKEVLYRTRSLSWGTDTHLYTDVSQLRDQFPGRLVAGTRVLKQSRGNGGIGVWKVSLHEPSPSSRRSSAALVRVQDAAPRGFTTEEVSLEAFIDRCASYFVHGGTVVDQPFAAWISDGMVRVYLSGGTVVGYARQHPATPPAASSTGRAPSIFGMPSTKTMSDADDPALARLRTQMETDWVPGMCRLLDLRAEQLPVLWDADFLYGPRSRSGDDTYQLCEINVSSVLPYPPAAPDAIAHTVIDLLALRERRHATRHHPASNPDRTRSE